MIGRAWSLFAGAWLLFWFWQGSTRPGGIQYGDIWLAVAPWWIGKIAGVAGRYVLTGSIWPAEDSPVTDSPRPPVLSRLFRVK